MELFLSQHLEGLYQQSKCSFEKEQRSKLVLQCFVGQFHWFQKRQFLQQGKRKNHRSFPKQFTVHWSWLSENGNFLQAGHFDSHHFNTKNHDHWWQRSGCWYQLVRLMKPCSNLLKLLLRFRRKCYFQDEKYLRYFNKYSNKKCVEECQSNITLSKCECIQFDLPRNFHPRC